MFGFLGSSKTTKALESPELAHIIWDPICIIKQHVEPLSIESKSTFFNCSSAATKAWVIIEQLFSFNLRYIFSGSFNVLISGWFIILEGINSAANC